jgi:outer membrane biosynthesis protein TonB
LIFEGAVKMKIMVSTGGDVICMWDVSGHPLMLASAVKAAHDWKFKPKIENRKPTEFVGVLELPVTANGDGY